MFFFLICRIGIFILFFRLLFLQIESSVPMNIQKDLYTVQRVVGRKKTQSGSYQYKIKWKGYPSYQNTWEPLQHLTYVQSLIKRYDQNYSKMKSRKRKARTQMAQRKGGQNYSKSQQKMQDKKSFGFTKSTAKVTQQNFKKQKKKSSKKMEGKKIENFTKSYLNESDSENEFQKIKTGALVQIQKHSTSIEQNGETPLINQKIKRKPRKNKQNNKVQKGHQKSRIHKVKEKFNKKIRKIKKQPKKKKVMISKQEGSHQNSGEDNSEEEIQNLQGKQKRKIVERTPNKVRKNKSSSQSRMKVKVMMKKTKRIKKEKSQILKEIEEKLRLRALRKSLLNKNIKSSSRSKKPFIITLRRLSRERISQHLPHTTLKARVSKPQRRKINHSNQNLGAESNQQRNRKRRSYTQIFIKNKLAFTNPTQYLGEYSRPHRFQTEQSIQSEENEESEENQIVTLKQKLEKYDKENKAEVSFDKESNLKIMMKNEDELDCEFNAKDLRMFYGEWLKSFYQQHI